MTHTPEPDPLISSVPADTTRHEGAGQREGTAPPETSTQQLRLTRSHDDRMIAGVCGGLARATNIDPILFRVILSVLVFFGGAGGLLYVLAWILLPAAGETASPAAALLGRGKSSTNAALTLVLAAVAAGLLAWMPSRIFPENALILGAAALGGYSLFRRSSGTARTSAGQ